MKWDLNFINEQNFETHVRQTILKYGENLEPFDLKKLNKNIIDPIKMVFDKSVYKMSWEEIIKSEIFRQRDKLNNNSIGYFHQNFFNYIKGCEVPNEGWDVIFRNPHKIKIDGETVSTIYVEMKNKHNTMNSAASQKIYIKMQNQLLSDDDCVCFLVEAIAKRSQNIKWQTSVDGKEVGHKKIRRVSIDKFFEIVTGDENAFFKICKILPETIQNIIEKSGETLIKNDTAFSELAAISKIVGDNDKNSSFATAALMLGFNSYNGFETLRPKKFDTTELSEYANEILKAR